MIKSSLNDLVLCSNHILVKPDPDYEFIKLGAKKGEGVKLHVPVDSINAAKHYSVTGTVLKLPEKLRFNGERLEEIPIRGGDLGYAASLFCESLDFDTTLDVKEGDKVWFHYMNQINCVTEGMIVEVEEHGYCMIVKVDTLFCYQRNEQMVPVNGWVWIKRKKYEEQDLDLDGIYRYHLENKPVPLKATVVAAAAPVKRYRDDNYYEGQVDLLPGQEILFDDRYGTPLEYVYHVSDELTDVIKIRRTSIFATV